MHINVAIWFYGKRAVISPTCSQNKREKFDTRVFDCHSKIQKSISFASLRYAKWHCFSFPDFGYYTFSWVIIFYHVLWLRRGICLTSNGNEGFPQNLDIECHRCHQTSDRQRRDPPPKLILPVDILVVRRDAKLRVPSRRLRHLANYHNLAARAGG